MTSEQTAGVQPAEGRDDLEIPGADVSGPPSEHPDAPLPGAQPLRDIAEEPAGELERRDELADQVGVGMPSPAGRDADVKPDVEIPDEQM
jgi:hypothetical protein